MSVDSIGTTLNAYSVQSVGKPAAQTTPSAVTSSKSVVVAISSKAVKVAPSSISDAITAYQTASYAGTLDKLGPITISDTSANLGSNFAVLAEMASKSKITSIKLTDKNASITTTAQALGNLADKANAASALFQKLESKLVVKVDNANVQYAIATNSPSKNVALQFAIADTATAISNNLDALSVLGKSKGSLRSITITSNSNLLSVTSDQLKSAASVINIISSYTLSINNVSLKSFTSLGSDTRIKSVSILDSAANILKSTSLISSNNIIKEVSFNDKKELSFSIAQMMALKNTQKVNNPSNGYLISDNALTVIAHIRYDLNNIISGAKTVSINDKNTANITLEDARVLTSISKLSKGTKYNLVEDLSSITKNNTKTDNAVRDNAEEVIIAKSYSIEELNNLSKLKKLKRSFDYSVVDTVNNILTESNKLKSVLTNGLTVTVRDTAANVAKHINALQDLAKNNIITIIELIDNTQEALPINSNARINAAEAIGKIASKNALITTFDLNTPINTSSAYFAGYTPDNKRLIGYAVLQDGSQQLFTVNKDGTGYTDYVPKNSQYAYGLFSNDGARYIGTFYKDGIQHAFTSKSDGTGFIDFSDRFGDHTSVSFSETQNKLIGSYVKDGNWRAFVSSVDGSNIIDLTPEIADSSWGFLTKDERQFVGTFSKNGSEHPFIINIDGTGFTDFTPAGAYTASGRLTNDETKFYGFYNGQKPFSINKDGSGFIDLAPVGSFNLSGAFSSDSRRYFGVYSSNSDSFYYSINTDGSGFSSHRIIGEVTQSVSHASFHSIINGSNNFFVSYSDMESFYFVADTDTDQQFPFRLPRPPQLLFTNVGPSQSIPNTNIIISNYDSGRALRPFSINKDGTNFIELAPENVDYIYGSVTADAARYFGTYYINNNSHPFISSLDGGYIKDLTPLGADGAWGNLIDNDSKFVGYYIKNNVYNTFLTDLDTNTTYFGPANSSSAQFGVSTDGSALIGRYTKDNNTFLFISQLDGSGLINLTPDGIEDGWIDLTTDKNYLYGSYTKGGKTIPFIANSDSTNFTKLAPPNATDAYFDLLPNGKYIVGEYVKDDGMSHLYKMNIDGSGFVDLTPSMSISTNGYYFSSDQKTVYSSYRDVDGKWQGLSISTVF